MRRTILRKWKVESWSPFFNFRDFLVWILVVVISTSTIYLALHIIALKSDELVGAAYGIIFSIVIMRILNIRFSAECSCSILHIISILDRIGYEIHEAGTLKTFRPRTPRWAQWDGNFVEIEMSDGAIRIRGPLFVLRRLDRLVKST